MKLRFSKPIYKSYDNDRITVCVYNCTAINSKRQEVFSFKVTAKATIAPNEIPSYVLGQRIAEGRAKRKAYSIASRKALEILLKVNPTLEELEDFGYQMDYLKDEELKHLSTLIK